MKRFFALLILLIIRQSSFAQGFSVEVCVNLTGPPIVPPVTATLVFTANGQTDTTVVNLSNLPPPYAFCFPAYVQMPDSGFFAVASGQVFLSSCGPVQSVSYNQVISGSTTINLTMQNCAQGGNCSAGLNPIPGTTLIQATATGSAPYTYSWDNGITFSGNSIFQLAAPGNYCVTIMDATGCTATACYYYSGGNCIASIGVTGSGPWTLTASGSGTPPLTFNWSNGATGQTITANSSGMYCLTVTDATGCSDTACINLNYANQCGAAIVELVDSTGTVYLEAIPDTGSVFFTSFLWSNGETSSVIYPSQPGQYCVQITYAGSCLANACYQFNPGNPVGGCSVFASATPDSLNQGWVNFQSFPVGTPPFTYQWQFSNGSTSNLANPTVNLSNNNGVNWASLTVTDATGCSSSYSLTVFLPFSNLSCNAWFAQSANYQFGIPGEVFFSDLSSSPSGINFYAWSFGDGDSSTLSNPSHVYASAGYYNVCLTIATQNGCLSTWCTSIYVDPAWWNSNPFQGPCTAGFLIFTAPSGAAGLLNIVNTSQGNNLQYTWDFGNGQIVNNPTPFVSYNNPGTYNICLSILDTLSGCSSTFCDSITVDSLGNVYRSPMSGNVGVRVSASPQPNSLLSIAAQSSQGNFDFVASPHPSNGILNIQLLGNGAGNLKIELLDVSGRTVLTKYWTGRGANISFPLNLQECSNGSYLLRIGTETETKTKRLIIQQ